MRVFRRGVMRRQVSLGLLLLGCLAFLLCANTASGQAVYGGIVGTVTDPQGNAVANAKVTVTNLTKGTTGEAVTNEVGSYSVTHLIPDNYKMHIEATGFKAYDVASTRVDVDTVTRVDAPLQVGAVTQSVEVTKEVPQLQTEKADVATVFEARTIEDLPIYNRNFTTFQLLSPGAQQLNWGHAASENPQGSQQIETNGQHFAGTAFELDGTDNQDPILGIIVINPNLEAINEVKITSQDYDAEFGKAIGAVVTSQTKSGTNEIHGSLFDFERSNSNFARNPFNQASGVPSGNWNQFGIAAGGPIRKNKLFVFGDYQGQRSHVGGSFDSRVPSSAERGSITSNTGANLSDYLAKGTQIFDPCTSTITGFTAACNVPLAERVAFAGNIIPANRLSQQAENLLALIPLPNKDPGANVLASNFVNSGNNTLDSDGFDVRSDFVATSKL